MRAPATTIAALCAGFLLAAACGSATKETPPAPDGPAAGEQARLTTSGTAEAHLALDDHRYLGAAFDVGNLRVWPIHTDAPLEIGEFLTLQEAQEKGVATVREIGGGSALGNS